jgi:hypothetical protein
MRFAGLPLRRRQDERQGRRPKEGGVHGQAATVVDLPAWREQQRRMLLSVESRRSRCQG